MRRFDAEEMEKLREVQEQIAEMNAVFERRSDLFDSIIEVLAGLKVEDLELVLKIVKALRGRE